MKTTLLALASVGLVSSLGAVAAEKPTPAKSPSSASTPVLSPVDAKPVTNVPKVTAPSRGKGFTAPPNKARRIDCPGASEVLDTNPSSTFCVKQSLPAGWFSNNHSPCGNEKPLILQNKNISPKPVLGSASGLMCWYYYVPNGNDTEAEILFHTVDSTIHHCDIQGTGFNCF